MCGREMAFTVLDFRGKLCTAWHPPLPTKQQLHRQYTTSCHQEKRRFCPAAVTWSQVYRRHPEKSSHGSVWGYPPCRRLATCCSGGREQVDGEAMDDDEQVVSTLSNATLWGLRLAAARAKEAARQDRLFSDPYSRYLACEEELEDLGVVAGNDTQNNTQNRAEGQSKGGARESRRAAAITRFLDEFLMRSIGAGGKPGQGGGEPTETKRPQVVLVGAGMDTRPYRLPWPKGTVIFEVGPGEALQYAKDIFKAASVRTPSGCLLRQVGADIRNANAINESEDDADNADLAPGKAIEESTTDEAPGKAIKDETGIKKKNGKLTDAGKQAVAGGTTMPGGVTIPGASMNAPEDWCGGLVKEGYLRDRPSLWVLEGLHVLDAGALTMMLADVSDIAAKGSVMAGSISKAKAVEAALSWSEWSPRNPDQPISDQDRIKELFAEYGLQAEVIDLDATLRSIGSAVQEEDLVLFAATQRRLSRYQQEEGWRELGRAEMDGGEEGFMDMN
eukprot:jgi/Mesvir1/11783/Mv00150-RA.1